MSLRSINLNLLPMLQALLIEKSVTRAATSLGLSQSAMSDALGRLRATLDDPLLVRAGGRTALTPRAVELIAPTQALCAQVESLLARPRFEPGSATRSFTIATADYGIFLVAKPWLDRLGTVAPGIGLRFVEMGPAVPAGLAERAVDFAMVPAAVLSDLGPPAVRHMPLGGDTAVALFRAGHRLAGGGGALSVADLAPFRMIGFNSGSEAIDRQRGAVFSGGQRFAPVAQIPHITLMPYLLLDGDDIAIVPQRLAARMTALLPLASAPLAFAPDPMAIALAWSPVQDADPGHRWFREAIAPAI